MLKSSPNPEFMPERILIIRLSSIGDIVLASPLVRILKRRFPSARIDFVAKERFADLVRFSPHLSRVLTLDEASGFRGLRRLRSDIRAVRYDLIVDIHKNFRSFFLRTGSGARQVVKYHKMRWPRFVLIKTKRNIYPGIVPIYRRYLRCVAHLGIADDGGGLELSLDPETASRVAARLSRQGLRGSQLIVGIAPGAGFATKRWLPQRFAELADMIVGQLDGAIVLLGDRGDRPIAQEMVSSMRSQVVDLVGKLSLSESAAAVAQCDLLVCNDTGLMHVACALGKKVVAIFGPTTEELGFFPVGPRTSVIQRDLECRPCSHVGSHSCPKGHFKCMKQIGAEEVFAEVRQLTE